MGESREDLLERDREIPYAYTRRVEDGVRHRDSGSANPEFADALYAEGVRFVVIAVEQYRLDLRDVGVDRDDVTCEIAVDECA